MLCRRSRHSSDLGASRPASFLELRKRTRSAGRATLCKVTKFTKLVELVK
nr:MAG TPA: hypothetical protein [Bacteriophage sp.]DAV54001.1 MAG TPA: hypothetical protein [Caudoviricetes sp.]